jgi:hypothetical protein
MEGLSPSQGFRPFAEFLRPAAVEGHFPHSEGQPALLRNLFHSSRESRNIEPAPGEQLFEREPLFRDLRMEGECDPPEFDGIFPLESFNTSRTEVAPRSDIVRKHFQNDFVFTIHETILSLMSTELRRRFGRPPPGLPARPLARFLFDDAIQSFSLDGGPEAKIVGTALRSPGVSRFPSVDEAGLPDQRAA